MRISKYNYKHPDFKRLDEVKNEKEKQPKKKKRRKKYKKRKKVVEEVVIKQKKEREYYRCIITSQNKLYLEVFKTFNKESALGKYNKILENNKKTVRFPVKYVSRDQKLMDAKYELLLLRRKKQIEETESLVRNFMGQLVPHKTNSDNMVIFYKNEFLMEETFWVYGYNPKVQRKDFNFILNDIVLNGVTKTKYPNKRILMFLNKLIVENDDDFDMIICKNENDCARLYSELQFDLGYKKIKNIFFSGKAKDISKQRWFEKIQIKTGWDKLKIMRKSTRP